MAKERNNRIESFLAAEEPRRPLFTASANSSSASILTEQSRPRPVRSCSTISPSEASTKSSATSYRRSDSTPCRRSSVSSRTSISVPPWVPPTFVQDLMIRPFDYGYDLPCEFFFAGCNLRFNPADFEAWISHTASHFGGSLPKKAMCTFCDDDDAVFQSDGDDATNWYDRMVHIGGHLENLTPSEHIRPDFWVIEHLWNKGLISREDYDHALKGTERPACKNTYPLDYELPETHIKKERELQQFHDLAKEDRRRRSEMKKGKSRHNHGYSNSNRPSKYNPRIILSQT